MKEINSFYNGAYVNREKDLVTKLHGPEMKKRRKIASAKLRRTNAVKAMLKRTGL